MNLKLNLFNKKQFKPILQDEVAECGLASLTMCFQYNEMNVSLQNLREKYPVSNDGLTMGDLIDICEEEGFIGNLYEAKTEELHQIQLPAVIHWSLNHFIVLTSIRKNKFYVSDPAIGEVEYTLEEFENKYTGYALEIIPDLDNNYDSKCDEWNQKEKTTLLSFKYFLNNSKRFKRSFLYTFSLMLIIQFLSMIFPIFTQVVIDEFIAVNNKYNMIHFCIAGIGLIFFRFYASILKGWTVIFIGYKWHEYFSQHFFKKLMRIPLGYFNLRGSSDIFSRFTSLQKLKESLTETVVEGLIDGFMVVITLTAMFFYSVKLSLIVLSFLLLFFTIKHYLYTKDKILAKKETLSLVKEDHYFLETIRSMESIKNFAIGKERYNGWKKRYLNSTNYSIERSKIQMWTNSIESLMNGIEDILILFIGATYIIDEQITLGMFFSFLAFKSICSIQSKSLISKLYDVKLLGIHLERLSDIENADEEVNVYGLPEYRNIKINGKIELKNIYFKHKGCNSYLFENFSLEIDSGENVVLIGKSGCGKSTLLKIIMGLLPIESGTILVDGINIKNYGLNNFRKQISVVSQGEKLMSDSIFNNIVFYKKEVDFEKVKIASKNAQIDDYITSLNMQYETPIDEMSSTISGGQAQRILIARALYRSPKILFLDEATSALDIETEKNIVTTIKSLGITRISIAHREESIKMADKIINLDDK